jgi:hypothetical protein
MTTANLKRRLERLERKRAQAGLPAKPARATKVRLPSAIPGVELEVSIKSVRGKAGGQTDE